ncbi:MAG: PaaI family thioesterase, partial [Deltaproteobacteria bacterium]|nr:PaaI family thioesterase [Deltaproteobacteria bacterium]
SVEIDNHDWVRNSFGTLNGGMVATLVELAGEQAARAVLGPEVVAADLELHYVGQSGEGPIRSHASRLRVGPDHCVSRVEVRDAGAGDKLLAIGTVHACRLA